MKHKYSLSALFFLLVILSFTVQAGSKELRRASNKKDPIERIILADGCDGAVTFVAEAVKYRDSKRSYKELHSLIYDSVIRNNLGRKVYDMQNTVGRFVYLNPALDVRSAQDAVMRQCALQPASFSLQ